MIDNVTNGNGMFFLSLCHSGSEGEAQYVNNIVSINRSQETIQLKVSNVCCDGSFFPL